MSKIGGPPPTTTPINTNQIQQGGDTGRSVKLRHGEKTGEKIFNGWIKKDSYETGSIAPASGRQKFNIKG